MVLSNTAVPTEYAAFREQVLRGEIAVNQEVSMEMNRTDFLITSPLYYYDDEAINGFIEFCEAEMTLTDGGDLTLLPTFKLWAESALSWYYFREEKRYNPKTRRAELVYVKRRLVNIQYLIVARGAAKSMYASLLQAYFLTIDTSTTHQIVTAPTMKQAEETMSAIRTAISRSKGPLFKFMTEGSILSNTSSKVKLASTKKGIENFMTNSIIEVRPMSIDKLQGLRTKVATIDEWLSGKVKQNVISAIEQGASKIADYFILATSSEGTERGGPGDSIKMELLDVLKGNYFNPHISIWYYRLDDISEIGMPDMWIKANPNLGATVTYDTYQRDVERAENVPSERSDIIAKRFGIPVEGFTYFFLYEETLLHRPQNFDGLTASLGIDLSQGDDFCAFTFLFPLGHERYGVKNLSFISEVKYKNLSRAMVSKYDEFINEGSLIVMNGAVLDMLEVYSEVDTHITEHQYDISAVGYDVYNSLEFMQQWVIEYGDYGVTKVKQGARTESVPLGQLKMLARERLLIFDQKLTKWTMGNSIAIQDNNGNYKLSKMRAEEKIDNTASLMDAWVAYKRNQEAFM